MLSSGIMQRAFAEAIVLGIACGPLGVWVLLLRRAYAAESISHAMLPGLVLAALAGAPLVLGAAGGVLVAAAGIAFVGGEIGVAVVVERAVRAGRHPRAQPAPRRHGSTSCCSATCSGSPTET